MPTGGEVGEQTEDGKTGCVVQVDTLWWQAGCFEQTPPRTAEFAPPPPLATAGRADGVAANKPSEAETHNEPFASPAVATSALEGGLREGLGRGGLGGAKGGGGSGTVGSGGGVLVGKFGRAVGDGGGA